MNRAKQLGWRERVVNGRVIFVPPPKSSKRKKKRGMSSFRSKQVVRDSSDPHASAINDKDMASATPALFEFLAVVPEDAGPNAQTASLTFFTEDGLFKCCLNDRALGAVCFASAETFDSCIAAMELQLASGNADWRESKKKKK